MSQNRPDHDTGRPSNPYTPFTRKKFPKRGKNRNHYNHPYNAFQYYSAKYNFQPRWAYWRKRPPSNKSHKTPEKQRSPSPFSGTEEYNLKKIQETSNMIKQRLMMPETEDANISKTLLVNDKVESESDKKCDNTDSEKTCVKTNKKVHYNVEEIHHKIITHITNLSHGKKVNLICANSSGYDVAIQQIYKQKKLELSKVLRDMCSNQSVENSEAINSIIPDIGIKIEDLPLEVIQELSSTLDVTFDEDGYFQNSDAGVTVEQEVVKNCDIQNPTPVIPETLNEENICLRNIKQEEIEFSEVKIGIFPMETSNFRFVPQNDNLIGNHDKNRMEIKDIQNPTPVIPETLGEESICLANIKQEVMEVSEDRVGIFPMETPGFEFAPQNDNLVGVNNENRMKIKTEADDIVEGVDYNNTASVCLQTDSPDLNSTSTQTDENSDNQFQIDQKSINNWDDAISAMLKIDGEISRLTNLRQSIFAALQEKEQIQKVKKTPKKTKKVQPKNEPKRKNISPEKQNVVKEQNKRKNGPVDINDESRCYDKVFKLKPIAEKISVITVIGKTLLAASEKGNIHYFSTRNGYHLCTLAVSPTPITSLCHWTTVKKHQIHFMVGSTDGHLREFNLKTRDSIRLMNLGKTIQCTELAWFYIFVGTSCGHLIRYSLKQNKIEFEEKISQDGVMVLKATQEGARRVLLVGMRNEPVCVRDAMSGLCLRTMTQLVTPTVYTLVLENSMVYCGTKLHDILVFSFHDGSLVYKHEATNSKGISCMKVVKNLLFASSYNGNIYVFDVKTHQFVGIIEGPGGVILSIEILKNLVIVGTMSLNFKSILIPDYMLEHNKI